MDSISFEMKTDSKLPVPHLCIIKKESDSFVEKKSGYIKYV